jgi:hypothetical protein
MDDGRKWNKMEIVRDQTHWDWKTKVRKSWHHHAHAFKKYIFQILLQLSITKNLACLVLEMSHNHQPFIIIIIIIIIIIGGVGLSP